MSIRSFFGAPIKASKDFIRNPSLKTFGGALLGGEKMNAEGFKDLASSTPWSADDRIVQGYSKNTVDSKEFQEAAGVVGALIAAYFGGGALAAGGSGAGAGGAAAGGTAAGSGAAAGGSAAAGSGAAAGGAAAGGAAAGGTAAGTAGSYSAGAYGTSAGYGGATAPAAYGASTAPQSAGLLSTIGEYANSGMKAMQAAQMAQGLFGPQQQQQPQMQQQGTNAPQILNSIAQADQQKLNQDLESQSKQRMLNQQIIQQMMGRRYG